MNLFLPLGPQDGTPEAYGGSRMSTFMLYLSDVQSGGRSAFPQIGIFIKPGTKRSF